MRLPSHCSTGLWPVGCGSGLDGMVNFSRPFYPLSALDFSDPLIA
jgi:hypothetical protein